MPRTMTVERLRGGVAAHAGDDRHEDRERRSRLPIVPSNSATTEAARNAVARLTMSHGSRLRSDSVGGVNTRSSLGDAGQPVDVLGRLVLDDVDDVVDRDDADQLVLLVDDRDREQVVGRDLPRDFFLVRVDARADQSRSS